MKGHYKRTARTNYRKMPDKILDAKVRKVKELVMFGAKIVGDVIVHKDVTYLGYREAICRYLLVFGRKIDTEAE